MIYEQSRQVEDRREPRDYKNYMKCLEPKHAMESDDCELATRSDLQLLSSLGDGAAPRPILHNCEVVVVIRGNAMV
jgi:hypothetical protein